jgi:hypothetical protein
MEILKIVLAPFKAVGTVGEFLFRREVLNRTEGAKFAKPRDYRERLNSKNTGLLLDG